MTITELIVCIVAGLGAGLGTGLAGLSAAAVVSPMLITQAIIIGRFGFPPI